MLDFLGLAPTAQVPQSRCCKNRPRSFRMSLEQINVVANRGPVKRIIWAPIQRVPRPCLCALCRDRAGTLILTGNPMGGLVHPMSRFFLPLSATEPSLARQDEPRALRTTAPWNLGSASLRHYRDLDLEFLPPQPRLHLRVGCRQHQRPRPRRGGI
jgi:hypothetical protein